MKPSRAFMPFTYKMMISYLLLVLLTDVAIGYMSYTMLVESRTEILETNIRSGMEQTRNHTKYQMDEVRRISDTLFGNVPFQRALLKTGEPLDIYLAMMDEIVPQLTAPMQLFANPMRIILYTKNGSLNIVPGDSLSEPMKESDYYVLSASEIEDRPWLRPIREGDDKRWLQVETDEALGNISHIRRLVSYNDYKTVIGYIRITVRLEDLLGNFDAFPIEEGITMRLVDRSVSSVIYQRGGAAPGGPADESAYLTLKQDIPDSPFTIETLVPRDYLRKDAKRLQEAIVMVCAVSFLVMALIGLIVARVSGRKIRKIVTLLRSFQRGSFEKRIRFGGNDEFVHIADAFNVMADNIQELIQSVYVQGIERKQAELEALQAQINPHFLYNTLSTISSLANMGETRQVTEMVKGLSKFYRLSLNEGRVQIPLGKELEQVETYLDIQRVKYSDGFAVYKDVDPDVLDTPVIKLILQPFVENIFKHAWYGERVAIRLVARRVPGRIELKVIDNGVGMKPETIHTLLDGPSQAGGYGLKNVNDRIKLRFGDEYGVEIASIYGAGTTVRITLPDRPSTPEG